MKILVTGATGFTGHNLAQTLLDAGHEVRILVRSKSRVGLPDHPALDVREGDIRDSVITSYSIHYTKLYESCPGRCRCCFLILPAGYRS